MKAVPAGNNLQLVAAYVAEKTGMAIPEEGKYQAFAVLDKESNFVAGVLISNFRDTDCEISCATESSAAWRPEVMRAVFTYVFEQLGCVRCTSITKKNNTKARRFLEALGFVLEGNLRRGYDGVKDALIYGLLAEECRFLEGFDDGEKERPERPASARSGGDGERAVADEQRNGGSAGEPKQDRPIHAAGVAYI